MKQTNKQQNLAMQINCMTYGRNIEYKNNIQWIYYTQTPSTSYLRNII